MPRKKGFKHSEKTKEKMRLKRVAYLAEHPEEIERLRAKQLGKKLSLEHIEILRRANSKPLSEGRKKKISKSLKGHPGYWTGRQHTPEYKAAMSEATMGHECSAERREKISAAQRGREFTEEHRERLSVARLGRVYPFHDTKPELAVKAALDEMGVQYLHPGVLPGIRSQFDFYIPSWKVLIQVDGCYFHACLQHFPLQESGEKMSRTERVDRDRFEEAELARLYPDVLLHRVWEHDLCYNPPMEAA